MSDAHNISDGDITIDFADPASGYVLVVDGHKPTVAEEDPARPERILPAEEEFRLYISGDDPDDAAQKLENLGEIVRRAARAWNDDAVDPVIYQYQVANSSLAAPLQALVIGPPENRQTLELPAGYDSAVMSSVIGSAQDPIIWRLRRRGRWLDAEESQSSSATAVPGIMTCTFASEVQGFSPCDIELDLDGTPSPPNSTIGGYLILSGASNNLVKLEAEAATKSNFSNHADAGASGGSVAQMNTGTTTGRLTWSGISINSKARRFHIFANAYRNGPDIDYELHVAPNFARDLPAVPFNSSTPTIPIYLGLLVTRDPLSELIIDVDASASVTGGDELEIDYVVIVADDDTTNILLVPGYVESFEDPWNETFIKHLLLEERRPTFYISDSGNTIYLRTDGVLQCNMRGNTFQGLMMMRGIAGGTDWKINNSYVMTITRRAAYRVPR